MQNRFMVFVWDTYYPDGGPNDLIGLFPDYESAVLGLKNHQEEIFSRYQNYSIYDVELGKIVNQNSTDCGGGIDQIGEPLLVKETD